MKALIVYFSKKGSNWYKDGISSLPVGNVAKMASIIQKATGFPVIEIERSTPYVDEYNACVDEARPENENDLDLPILNEPYDLKEYDTLVIGFPIWFGTLPQVLRVFVKKYAQNVKDVYFFCSSEGSGFGHSKKDLKTLFPNAIIHEGIHVRGYKVDDSISLIETWANKIN